ncbi:hypothetical protein VIGAN_08035500 [Vigna angularis var. angularis]|uniref:Amino acid permease/ SLC12A domain-containing protein n=1 Tax=Vigna angularis var. angularis TaxID=157739 RepID=A0A0S3SLW2_PHAAN|nr:hypothetical protein VIGAN_08035500 [Vigna angularis var. angularis]
MLVALSMAEICSSYPTIGGLYYWSAKLAGPRWAPFASWITGWFNIIGQWAGTTSVDFSLAQLIQVIILLSTGGKNGGGHEASKYVVIAFSWGNIAPPRHDKQSSCLSDIILSTVGCYLEYFWYEKSNLINFSS